MKAITENNIVEGNIMTVVVKRRVAGKRRRAFTLVEVIVVLIILAILAAIAIPALTGYIEKGQLTKLKTYARQYMVGAQSLINEYWSQRRPWPDTSYSPPVFYASQTSTNVKVIFTDQLATRVGFAGYGLSGLTFGTYGLEVLNKYTEQLPHYRPNHGEGDRAFYQFVDENGAIRSWSYLDPSYMEDDTDKQYYIVTYNMTYENGTDLKYDPDAGLQLWEKNDTNYTLIN